MSALAKILVALAAMPVGMAIDGWAIATLWRWFVVPLGIRPLGIFQACGLGILVGLVIHRTVQKAKDSVKESLAVLILAPWLTAALAVGLGWLAHMAM